MSVLQFDSELISIVCPARNAADYLPLAIQSVLNQSEKNWELLIIDDGSSDETHSLVREFQSKDPRIFLIRNEISSGVHAARNAGLGAAKGRWVAFLDADDEWVPEKLEKTIFFATENRSPLTFTGYRAMDVRGVRLGNPISVPQRVSYQELLTLNVIVTSSVIVDRALTGQITMRDVPASDFVCWLEILRSQDYGYGLSEALVRYRLTPGSLSRRKADVPRKIWRIYREVEMLPFFRSLRCLIAYLARSGRKYLEITRLLQRING